MIGLVTAIFTLTGCGETTSKLDRTDPASVTNAVIISIRDNDLEMLASTIHPERDPSARQILRDVAKTGVAPSNHPELQDWDMFDPEESLSQDIKAWQGYLKGPKFDDDYGEIIALYAFTEPDEYDEHTVLVLENHSGDWYLHDYWFLKQAEFDALADRPEGVASD